MEIAFNVLINLEFLIKLIVVKMYVLKQVYKSWTCLRNSLLHVHLDRGFLN